MLSQSIVYIPVVICLLLISFFSSYRKHTQSVLFFSLLTVSMSFWLFSQYLTQIQFLGHPLFFAQLADLFSNSAAYALLLFIITYKRENAGKKVSLKTMIYLGIGPLLFAITSFTRYSIRSVLVDVNGFSVNDAGALYWLQVAFVSVYLLISIVILISDTRQRSKEVRTPNYYLLLALGQAGIINFLINTVFVSYSWTQFFVPLSLFFMAMLIAYSILKHRLFDIRTAAARSTAYIFLLSFIILGYTGTAVLFSRFFFRSQNISFKYELVYLSTGILTALSFSPLKRFFDRVTARIFFRDAYDPQKLLDALSTLFVSEIEIDTMLQKTIKLLAVNIGIFDGTFILHHSDGLELSKGFITADPHKLYASLEEVQDDVYSMDQGVQLSPYAQKVFKLFDVRMSLRLRTKTDQLGYMLLRGKKSGESFSTQDMRVLSIITDELAISVQNALRFEQIEHFNITLQQKINRATRELKLSNEKLKALDEAKDEFISMASHQLRTPLTSIKGYLSMVLEGDVGAVSAQQKEMLGQAFVSSQRMVYLISDLLNVSRMQTGKFVIEAKDTNLPDVVEAEIAQLHETIKARGLKIEFKKPDTFPVMHLDETKIRQVIMNFADNAVYYTPVGGTITIELVEKAKSVEYLVHDTGIGVPKTIQHKLFAKFYRAENAQRARPDGTGLGLYMAKKVIIASGGAIIFKSIEGKGSTFGFTFPKK